ncbi:Uncharacterised protein [Mycobacteroides abscessus subsp. abscessus]|uniref:hypothetical protein n=1 Tax=Mycobacteroides abscessus TaxID=36809 RepID=UPI00092CDC92|nr:hypothetical protein [Mycobacteroides abscessus]SII19889.1 Uncharacterised protein [Mycobacteroides abscessus subsp. abscessus]SII33265.1 Uncharacterised protein [Mycobacteroides abscessus subsp. abscessus]SII65536.1 Uncharacterised protein [Mycobacteroides abscessus subsp. abscessus]
MIINHLADIGTPAPELGFFDFTLRILASLAAIVAGLTVVGSAMSAGQAHTLPRRNAPKWSSGQPTTPYKPAVACAAALAVYAITLWYAVSAPASAWAYVGSAWAIQFAVAVFLAWFAFNENSDEAHERACAWGAVALIVLAAITPILAVLNRAVDVINVA